MNDLIWNGGHKSIQSNQFNDEDFLTVAMFEFTFDFKKFIIRHILKYYSFNSAIENMFFFSKIIVNVYIWSIIFELFISYFHAWDHSNCNI